LRKKNTYKGKKDRKEKPQQKTKVQRNKGGRTLRQTLEENTLEMNELSKEHY
jgi:hypothetical protein